LLFALGGAIRAFALKRAVENIALYIRKIEGTLAARSLDLMGWETFRRLKPPAEGFTTSGVMWSAWLFWALMILATILIPLSIRQKLPD
jgi:hypothetical protein